MSGYAQCPRCARTVALKDDKFRPHRVVPDVGERCRMTDMRNPIRFLDEESFEDRAKLVGELANHIQDYDPSLVWEYLTCLSAAEVQRLLVVALAAVPVDVSRRMQFAWVHALPIAQEVEECRIPA